MTRPVRLGAVIAGLVLIDLGVGAALSGLAGRAGAS